MLSEFETFLSKSRKVPENELNSIYTGYRDFLHSANINWKVSIRNRSINSLILLKPITTLPTGR